MGRVLILADDLTGAADAAAAFLGRARSVTVALEPGAGLRAPVLAVDLDTRAGSVRVAKNRVRAAIAGLSARRAPLLFKKIDSTLRGHVVAELRAARDVLGAGRPIIVAPAFPAQKRVVRGGRLYVRGKAHAENVVRALSAAGFTLADALNDAELDAIARRGLAMRPRPLFVGSAGLAHAIARQLPRIALPRAMAARRPIVSVVGSASPTSRQQARRLERAAVATEGHLLLCASPLSRGAAISPRHARRLARLVARVLPDAHYVLTGGETARRVLKALHVNEFRLLGEVEPGVPYGISADGALICTKAGAFGDRDTLLRCVRRLKQLI